MAPSRALSRPSGAPPLRQGPESLPPRRACDYKSERERLESFAGFPFSHLVSPRQLAAAGFWYTKVDDKVCCAFCNVEIAQWEPADDPMEEHRKWSRNCSFLQRMDVGNIPLDPAEPLQLPPREPASYDECSIYNIKMSEDCAIMPPLEKLGIQKRYPPAHPMYVMLEARLESFSQWPIGLKLTPQQLAEAGFFYTGLGDHTICFQCNGGMTDWVDTDDPWRSHAMYFPKCSFVIQSKGQEYITEVVGEKPATLTPEEMKALNTSQEFSNVVDILVSAPCTSPSAASEATASSSQGSSGELPSQPSQPPVGRPDDGRACKICFSQEIGVAFLPCGHLVACVKCASSLSTCAVCRKPFCATVRVFMS